MLNKRLRIQSSDFDEILNDLANAKQQTEEVIKFFQSTLLEIERKEVLCREEMASLRTVEEEEKKILNDGYIRLNLRGKVFETSKEVLVATRDTFFFRMFASPRLELNADGTFFIDRCNEGFDRILEYMSTGQLSCIGLNEYEIRCVYDNLDYFMIPHDSRWLYDTPTLFEKTQCREIIQLQDGRLCGHRDNLIIIWDLLIDTKQLVLHSPHKISRITQAKNGRIIGSTFDGTIFIWSLITCKVVHSFQTDNNQNINCLLALQDGKLCTCTNNTIKVWDTLTGNCTHDLLVEDLSGAQCLIQLRDGRLCSASGNQGGLCIWNKSNFIRVKFLQSDVVYIDTLVEIDDSRVCFGTSSWTIVMWNFNINEIEKEFIGHNNFINDIILLNDGRMCSVSDDSTMILWNIGTGETERIFSFDNMLELGGVIQLNDGRLITSTTSGEIYTWN